MLGSAGRRVPSLYHLYVGGGEASPSWQVRMADLPVVTDWGILHRGGDGGTAGNGEQFIFVLHHTVLKQKQSLYTGVWVSFFLWL